jgi:hypothetical protein
LDQLLSAGCPADDSGLCLFCSGPLDPRESAAAGGFVFLHAPACFWPMVEARARGVTYDPKAFAVALEGATRRMLARWVGRRLAVELHALRN